MHNYQILLFLRVGEIDKAKRKGKLDRNRQIDSILIKRKTGCREREREKQRKTEAERGKRWWLVGGGRNSIQINIFPS